MGLGPGGSGGPWEAPQGHPSGFRGLPGPSRKPPGPTTNQTKKPMSQKQSIEHEAFATFATSNAAQVGEQLAKVLQLELGLKATSALTNVLGSATGVRPESEIIYIWGVSGPDRPPNPSKKRWRSPLPFCLGLEADRAPFKTLISTISGSGQNLGCRWPKIWLARLSPLSFSGNLRIQHVRRNN